MIKDKYGDVNDGDKDQIDKYVNLKNKKVNYMKSNKNTIVVSDSQSPKRHRRDFSSKMDQSNNTSMERKRFETDGV